MACFLLEILAPDCSELVIPGDQTRDSGPLLIRQQLDLSIHLPGHVVIGNQCCWEHAQVHTWWPVPDMHEPDMHEPWSNAGVTAAGFPALAESPPSFGCCRTTRNDQNCWPSVVMEMLVPQWCWLIVLSAHWPLALQGQLFRITIQ